MKTFLPSLTEIMNRMLLYTKLNNPKFKTIHVFTFFHPGNRLHYETATRTYEHNTETVLFHRVVQRGATDMAADSKVDGANKPHHHERM